MKFLTFDNLFDKNIHINTFKNLKKFDNNLYKIIKNSCIVNLTYTSIYLYKLYKIFYVLHLKNMYATVIHRLKFSNNKFVKMLLKFTDNNFLSSKYWVNGIITNDFMLYNIIILGIWINKFYLSNNNVFKLPKHIVKIKNKIEYICLNLKFKKFSNFIFLLNLDKEKYAIKECLISNKFIMGICNFDYNTKLIDFFIYSNNINEIALHFVIKFIVAASFNGILNKNNKNIE